MSATYDAAGNVTSGTTMLEVRRGWFRIHAGPWGHLEGEAVDSPDESTDTHWYREAWGVRVAGTECWTVSGGRDSIPDTPSGILAAAAMFPCFGVDDET